jgi:myo-inositol-1(or 4)-monophosphatase
MTPTPEALARIAERAAARAAAFLRAAAPPDPAAWESKGHHDFVTALDRGAEERIVETLLRATPDATIVAEESAAEGKAGAGLTWIIDPLDGTANFLHRHPAWAVSIGAALDGELVAGTILHGPTHERATAWHGGGAWIGGERLAVSPVKDPGRALIGTGFPFKHPGMLPDYLGGLERVLAATSGVRRNGSAALDLLDVARGRFAGFWEMRLAPWDMAAGIVLVREAGGVVTRLDGAPIGVEHAGVIAGNAAMAAWLLGAVGPPT